MLVLSGKNLLLQLLGELLFRLFLGRFLHISLMIALEFFDQKFEHPNNGIFLRVIDDFVFLNWCRFDLLSFRLLNLVILLYFGLFFLIFINFLLLCFHSNRITVFRFKNLIAHGRLARLDFLLILVLFRIQLLKDLRLLDLLRCLHSCLAQRSPLRFFLTFDIIHWLFHLGGTLINLISHKLLVLLLKIILLFSFLAFVGRLFDTQILRSI